MATQDFRAYVQANAPQYLGYVGNDVNGQGTTGINVGKLQGAYGSSGRAPLNTGASYNDAVNGIDSLYGNYSKTLAGPYTQAAATSTANNGYTSGDIAYLDDQANDVRSLLGRTDTGLNQGLDKLNRDYQSNVNTQTGVHNQAIQDLVEKGVADTKAKQGAYDTINQNAHNGYKSLAAIIGRGAGTGSSAFQELLPNVVGSDISGKRSVANDTYAENTARLDKSRKQNDDSFSSVIADLNNQRTSGEQDLRTGVEQQRQSLQQQLGGLLGQKAQAQGGGYAQVKAAQAPTQAAVENSRNSVDNFFNQFKTPIAAQTQVVATPTLDAYNVDRSTVNAAGNADTTDDVNPYANILRKQLLQGAS